MRLINSQIIKISVFFLVCAGAALADSSGHFGLRAGIGYDFISQEYFLDSLRYVDADSSLKSALLKKDYLDDKKGFVYLKYFSPTESGPGLSYRLEAGWEQTPEVYRALGWGRFEVGGVIDRLESDFRMEIKNRYKGAIELGEELAIFNGSLAYRRHWSDFVESKVKFYGENISFDTVGSYVYNYSRYGLELAANILTENFNSIYLATTYEIRNVPDSGQLDYRLIRGSGGYFGTFSGFRLTADLSLENRLYEQPAGQDDYFLLSINSEAQIQIGQDYFFAPKFNLEYFNYRADDPVNDDHSLIRVGLLPGREFGSFSIALGPKLEILTVASDFVNDNDYLELMASAEIDYFGMGGLFFLFENQFGQRDYRQDLIYTSEFIFDRISLIGSARIFDGFNLDILFSAEWEWHEIDSDNSRLYLISTGLSYQF